MGRYRYTAGDAARNFRAIDRTVNRRADTLVTAAYTAKGDDDTLVCDTSGGAFTLTLPLITAELRGKVFTVVTIADGVNLLTVAPTSPQTINGGGGLASAATYTPQRYQAVRLTAAPTYGWVSV